MVDPKIHFGLGDYTEIDSLHVCWPDGKVQLLLNIQSDQILTLRYRPGLI